MGCKLVTVAEVNPFPAAVTRAGLSEDERQELTVFLANNPEAGDVIPGTGGLRKLRRAGNGKGKSGGYRVIYYFYNDSAPVYLLTMYAKGERMDLTAEQKKRLTALAGALKAELIRPVKVVGVWRAR